MEAPCGGRQRGFRGEPVGGLVAGAGAGVIRRPWMRRVTQVPKPASMRSAARPPSTSSGSGTVVALLGAKWSMTEPIGPPPLDDEPPPELEPPELPPVELCRRCSASRRRSSTNRRRDRCRARRGWPRAARGGCRPSRSSTAGCPGRRSGAGSPACSRGSDRCPSRSAGCASQSLTTSFQHVFVGVNEEAGAAAAALDAGGEDEGAENGGEDDPRPARSTVDVPRRPHLPNANRTARVRGVAGSSPVSRTAVFPR